MPDDGVVNDPNDPFAGIVGNDFNSVTLETIALLRGFANAFILCGFLFNGFAGIPFFNALLYASLAIGVVMAFFGLAMQFPVQQRKAYERQQRVYARQSKTQKQKAEVLNNVPLQFLISILVLAFLML